MVFFGYNIFGGKRFFCRINSANADFGIFAGNFKLKREGHFCLSNDNIITVPIINIKPAIS